MGQPFLKTVNTSAIAAALLGLVLMMVLPRHASFAGDFLDAFTVAFCFTFIGQYVDRLLLGLPGIQDGAGRLVRVAGWFAGGLWCHLVAGWLWIKYGRDLNELPRLVWGGVFLVIWQPLFNSFTRRQDAPT
ncbi:MAG TPA: hypothetical protein VEU74_05450 [Gemmatimonadales bacterium]|nr:hypothetical protein [Gemmatimonadales bacterium]